MEGQEEPIDPLTSKEAESKPAIEETNRSTITDHDRKILFWILTVTLFGFAVYVFGPFFQALLTGIVLAVLMKKPYRWFASKMKDTVAAGLTVLITALILVIPFVLLGLAAGVQIYEFAQSIGETGDDASTVLEGAAGQLDQTVAPFLSRIGIENFSALDWLQDNRGEIASRITSPLVFGAQRLVYVLVGVVIALFSQFFLLRDGHKLVEPAASLLPMSRPDFDLMVNRLGETIMAVFQGFILVGIIQGGLAGILYFVASVPGAWFWMLVTMLFSIIPLIGPPVTYIPISLYLFAIGRPVWGIVVLAAGFLVLSTIDNILKPLFIGPKAHLHTLAVFFAILAGVVAFGPVGVMAGPLLLTVLLEIMRLIAKQRQESTQAVEQVAT